MPADEQVPATEVPEAAATTKDAEADQKRSEKILMAKELYSSGSRNFLVKSFSKAADELSQVCEYYEELYGELSDELGMPYLLYAKSLIALALEENKVIDVADVEPDDDDDDDDEDEDGEGEEGAENAAIAEAEDKNGGTKTAEEEEKVETKSGETNGCEQKQENNEVDSTSDSAVKKTEKDEESSEAEKAQDEAKVSSTDEGNKNVKTTEAVASTTVDDGEKPSTSNGDAVNGANGTAENDEEDNEAASTLQLAWEILELAAKIFTRQGLNGLPNLAETLVELANIEFENNIPDGARDDYEKALKIYGELPNNYRRAMAEVFYKIGLTYLMQTKNQEAAKALMDACAQLEDEIQEIESKTDLTEKDRNNIADMKETQEEIRLKIKEIEETEAQNMAEVRAALNSYIQPKSGDDNDAGASSSKNAAGASGSASISSTTKPTDISHLIKRKKPDEPTSEAESSASPAKRPAA